MKLCKLTEGYNERMDKTIWLDGKEYAAVRLLGRGKGGYSYLVTEGKGQYVLKQIHHEPCGYYQFRDKLEAELRDYERLRRLEIPMPRMLAVDREREWILKEFIDGETVLELVLRDVLPGDCLEQMRSMCVRLYRANTNIDYFPTNFILQNGRLYYIDYECNDYMEQWNFENWGIKYWSKTPELLEYMRTRA